MSVRKFYPKNALTEAVASAPPRDAGASIAQAQGNVATLAAECAARVNQLVDGMLASFASDRHRSLRLMEIYAASSKLCGLGVAANLPGVDAAAGELCAIIDLFEERGVVNEDAVRLLLGAIDQFRSRRLNREECDLLVGSFVRSRRQFSSTTPSAVKPN